MPDQDRATTSVREVIVERRRPHMRRMIPILLLSACLGRLYANQIVDHPYTRFAVTDEAQSRIVPILMRQER
jgi:hypothetical protein